jgi:hypothetical protein
MSDEQTIYISPDDDLTSVRERLEQLPSRRITLVIPSQTQLRSHVAWNLLHKRARELGKKVLIVSSDPQIRSVAQAVNFDVARSLESPSASRSRPPSRPGRNVRGAGSAGGRSRRSQQPQQWPDEPTTPQPRPTEAHIEEEAATAGPPAPLPSSYDTGSHYERPYNFRHDEVPSIQPLAQEQIEEEPDLLLEDYQQARDIRLAAQRASERQGPASTPQPAPVTPRTPQESIAMPMPDLSDDPFAYMEDSQPPPSIREQRGSALVQDYDSDEHPAVDISEMPTSVIENEIEYRSGDRGEFESRPEAPPTPASPSWAAPASTPAREPVGAPGSEFDEDALPPVEDRPTQEPPPARPAAAAAASAAGAASNRPLQLPETRPRTARPTPRLARPGARTVQSHPTPARRSTGISRAAAARRRPGRVSYVAWVMLALVALLLGALAYFGPSADVTITMLSRDYSHQVKLITLTGPGAAAPGTVRAVTLTHVFSKSSTGTATSNTEVGNVIFTNNGSSPVEIPTGTVLSAGANGPQFVTTADAVVPSQQGSNVGNTIQVPVRAQQAGAAGHVGSGAITVIPTDSLNAIAQANNVAVSSLKLSVTNSAPTITGGTGGPAIITAQDLDNAKKALHTQLQGDIDAWVQRNLAPGDVKESVSTTDTLVNAPKQGQLVDQGTFPVTLNVNVSMQVVRSAAIQAASIAELHADMSKDKAYNGYMIVADQQHPLVIPQKQIKIGGSAPAWTLTFPATAQVTPDLSVAQVQRKIAGRSIKDAQSILMGISGVQKVDIRNAPGFVSWVTFWPGHINVHFVAGTPQTGPKVQT